MIFTFSKEPDGTVFEDNQPHCSMSFKTLTMTEVLENFEDFLKGCGFIINGHLEIVEDK